MNLTGLKQRYVVWKQPCEYDTAGRRIWKYPYIYALTAGSRTAIELCRYAIRQNPSCRVWRQPILDDQLPDPDDVGPHTRDYWRRAVAHHPARIEQPNIIQ